MNLVQLIKRTARHAGFEVHRYNPVRSLDARFFHLLGVHGVDGVYDVGANDGQFGTYLREGGYAGPIVSFEPLEEAHRTLAERARSDPAWTVAPRGAVGGESGVLNMQVAGNSTSSSLLPLRAWPSSSLALAIRSSTYCETRSMFSRLSAIILST